jgi:cytoskeletal protein CcmA (bactofilin family)
MRRSSLALLCILGLLPVAAMAQQFTQQRNQAAMRLGNDLYTAGNLLTIGESVPDDLLVAGNRITITGPVGGDVLTAASNLQINAGVGGDVRVLAGDAFLNGNVAGDVIAIGGTVIIGPDAVIDGNIVALGGQIELAGSVAGNVLARGGSIAFTGSAGGSADIRGDDVHVSGAIAGNARTAGNDLDIDAAASIGGDLTFWSLAGEEQEIAGTVTGATAYNPDLRRTDPALQRRNFGMFTGILGVVSLFSLFSAALAIGLFQFLTRTLFTDSAARLQTAPGWSILWGLIYFVLTPLQKSAPDTGR